MDQIKLDITVRELLFVCVPLGQAGEQADEYTEDQIRALEHILKVICQPAFGDA